MRQVGVSLLSAFQASKSRTLGNLRIFRNLYFESPLSSHYAIRISRLCSTSSTKGVNDSGNKLELELETASTTQDGPNPNPERSEWKPSSTSTQPESQAQISQRDPSGEDIISRLRRLSVSSPEEYMPSAPTLEEQQKAKQRYKAAMMDHKSRFSRIEQDRRRNPNYRERTWNNRQDYDSRSGGRSGGNWDGFQFREFNTSAYLFADEGILDRLKRLSVTAESDYKPSEQAAKVRREAEEKRKAQGRVSDMEFDQRNLRPKNQSNSNYRNRYRANEWDDDRGGGRNYGASRYNNNYGERTRDFRGTGGENDGYGQRRPYRPRNDYDSGDFDRNNDYRASGNEDYEERRSSRPRNYNDSYGERREFRNSKTDTGNYGEEEKKNYYQRQREYDKSYFMKNRKAWRAGDGFDDASNKDKSFAPTPMNGDGDNGEELQSQTKKSQARSKKLVAHLKEFGYNKNSELPVITSDQFEKHKPQQSTDELIGQKSKSKMSKEDESKLDLSKLTADEDTFGTLSMGTVPVKDYIGASVKKELMSDEQALGLSGFDDEEEDDVQFTPDREVRWTMKILVRRIKELVDQMKVKEAVDTLFAAQEEGGFQFDRNEFVYAYNLCIASCAQVGYVKMAFKLYSDMKKRGYVPKESTYTSLFNTCANSTWDAEKNIERMNNLRQSLLDGGVFPNQIICHAMIKGYGRNGDIESAFGVVDEMITQGEMHPNTETFNMLLQACISNTVNGFRHVLVTWRKMQSLRIRPDIYTYNLLLRSIRECGIQPEPLLEGDEDEDKLEAKQRKKSAQKLDQDLPMLRPVVSEEESNDMLDLICLNNSEKALMNINQNMENVENVQFSYTDLIEALRLPQNRLSVLGGLRGIMSQMSLDKVGPNLKTITELGQIIHPGDVSDLVMLMKTFKLKPDIVFFNILIKRCYFMGNAAAAKKLTAALVQFDLTPNIMTWGVTATGCNTLEMAKQLLEEMDNANFTPNIQIMGALLHKASHSFDPVYVSWVMEETRRRETTPDTKFVLMIEEFKQSVKKGLVSQEMGKPILPHNLKEVLETNANFEQPWKAFLYRYDSWMKSTEIRVEPKDPWEKDFETFRRNRSHRTEYTSSAGEELSEESATPRISYDRENEVLQNAAKSS